MEDWGSATPGLDDAVAVGGVVGRGWTARRSWWWPGYLDA